MDVRFCEGRNHRREARVRAAGSARVRRARSSEARLRRIFFSLTKTYMEVGKPTVIRVRRPSWTVNFRIARHPTANSGKRQRNPHPAVLPLTCGFWFAAGRSSRSNQFSPNLAEFALVLEVAAPTNPQLGENVREMELNGTLLDT